MAKQKPQNMWTSSRLGARLKSHLPVTVDSLIVAMQSPFVVHEKLTEDGWLLKEPLLSRPPIWRRAVHAWLVLTGSAMAVQFSRQHFIRAGERVLPEGTEDKALNSERSLKKSMAKQAQRELNETLFSRYRDMASPALTAYDKEDAPTISGVELSHIHWMCLTALDNLSWPQDKLNRWLGYVQAMLIRMGFTTLADERCYSRDLYHTLYALQGLPNPKTTGA